MTPKKTAKERRLARSDMKRRRVAKLAMGKVDNPGSVVLLVGF